MRLPVLNALGVLDDPNLPEPEAEGDAAEASWRSPTATVSPRALADARRSGLRAVNVTLGHVAGPGDPLDATWRDLAAWDALIAAHPDALRPVRTGADIDAAAAAGQVGVIYGFQNTEMLGRDPARIDDFARRGVRVIQLTYNGRNALGDGATVADDRGLSALGAEMLERLEAQRVLVDLSHSSERTCRDALRRARRPLAITHTGCRAIADHPRNKSDAELRLVAEGGGVVGLYFMPYLRLAGQPLAADLVAHLEHALQVCGEDHVGLGTDGGTTAPDDLALYRGRLEEEVETRRRLGIGAPGETADVVCFLPDLSGPGQFERLAESLAARGHGEARIAKILGGNFRRLMGECWG
jgi:membrane dipeptidase